MASDVVARILAHLDTLTVAELEQVDRGIHPLLDFYRSMQRPGGNILDQRIIPGGCFRLEGVRCGKSACKKCAAGGYPHGPYWYKYVYSNGRHSKTYIGKILPAEVHT